MLSLLIPIIPPPFFVFVLLFLSPLCIFVKFVVDIWIVFTSLFHANALLYTKSSTRSSTHLITVLPCRARYRLRIYPNTFNGNEMVDLLIEKGEARTRDAAKQLGRRLMQAGIIRHVMNEQDFRDEQKLCVLLALASVLQRCA